MSLELLIFRLMTGLGLGGAMPNAIALTAEYCPERRRATLVMIMFTGFSLGAAFGGALAAWLIPAFGWRSVWYVGGVAALLVPLQFAALPDSIRFLVVKEAARDRIAKLVRRIDRSFAVPAEARFEIAEARAPGVPVAHLFRGNRTSGTILLWIMFFCNLLAILSAELDPDHRQQRRHSRPTAVVIGTLFQVGGVIAVSSSASPSTATAPIRSWACSTLWAACSSSPSARAGSTVPALMLTTFGAGFCVVGGQNSANALAAIFYPTAMRATGVGWSLGIGRIGAILGPLIGGCCCRFIGPTERSSCSARCRCSAPPSP